MAVAGTGVVEVCIDIPSTLVGPLTGSERPASKYDIRFNPALETREGSAVPLGRVPVPLGLKTEEEESRRARCSDGRGAV